MKIGKHIIHRARLPKNFNGEEWTYEIEDRDVILLAIYKGYAMIRRPRCIPYVCQIKELIENENKQ